ncbi:hypothetical protein [Streptomyces sp. NBC_01497]|uniref:hypothetical protein n=1 Tax=Streptomyces sp. NBC_01497 TaxID=2903885 RepID=UPI002E32F312|nr:hypothetical protein [Streptomyces sp. NBC_01497]
MSTADWKPVANRQLVPGSGKDQFVFQRQFVQAVSGYSLSPYYGFSVNGYSKKEATVGMIMESSGGYASTTVRMKWAEGDWKIDPSGDGELFTPVSTEASPVGYVPWGGKGGV